MKMMESTNGFFTLSKQMDFLIEQIMGKISFQSLHLALHPCKKFNIPILPI
jgi:hypothetical protein